MSYESVEMKNERKDIMAEERVEPKPIDLGEYKFGFHDDVMSLSYRQEKDWMKMSFVNYQLLRENLRDVRIPFEVLWNFQKNAYANLGSRLVRDWFWWLDLLPKPSDKPARSWDEVPEKSKKPFERIGIPEAERAYPAGASAQYESEVVYHNMKEEFQKLGIIFTDTDSALKEYQTCLNNTLLSWYRQQITNWLLLTQQYGLVEPFIYVPKGVKVDIPLQTYFRINNENTGQFERTLIIVDEGASVHYVEGCTAPTYSSNSLHAAIVEIFALDGAYMRYTTIQNWSDNVYNLVTKRAKALKDATVEWIDGNLGAKTTMKYPSVYLDGEGARGTMLSIAFANAGQHQDTGAKMIHNAPHTSSSIVSKSIAKGGGRLTTVDK